MCNNYRNDAQLTAWAEDFDRFLGRHLTLPLDPSNLTYRNDVYPKYEGLFVRPIDPQDPAGDLEPAVGRWGLIPFFHKGPAKDWKAATNNCRSEDMATKASFRDAVKRKRCIIPVTSFCEFTGPKGKMTKHQITRAGGGPLFLAGLWASTDCAGERVESYTMVMQEAVDGDDMRPFHNRQPVFLTAENVGIWLDLSADVTEVVRSPLPGSLAFDPPEPAMA